MKRIVAFIFALVLSLALVGCGAGKNEDFTAVTCTQYGNSRPVAGYILVDVSVANSDKYGIDPSDPGKQDIYLEGKSAETGDTWAAVYAISSTVTTGDEPTELHFVFSVPEADAPGAANLVVDGTSYPLTWAEQ